MVQNWTGIIIYYWWFTDIVSVAKYLAALAAYPQGQCLMDTFMVTSPGNPTPPVICGTNSGEHSKYYDKEIKTILLKYPFN